MIKHLSVVTNCHDEGHCLGPTIGSVSIAIENARSAGLEIEWIFVLDNADAATRSTLQNCAPAFAKMCDTTFGDPGLARNSGIEAASGQFLALVDGDDLVSPNWLVSAYELAVKFGGIPTIYHPGYEFYFGETNQVRVGYDSDDPIFSPEILFEETGWPITSLAKRENYLKHPFQPCDLEHGFAHEDTQWNCDTIAAGIRHKLVPGTFFCYRIKKRDQSWNARVNRQRCMMGPSRLFDLPFQRAVGGSGTKESTT